jgi:hypothetical protein
MKVYDVVVCFFLHFYDAICVIIRFLCCHQGLYYGNDDTRLARV